MSIEDFNNLDLINAYEALEKCCGSSNWVISMLNARPFLDIEMLQHHADLAWAECDEDDALEAFDHHPKIGDLNSLKEKFQSTANWAGNEQASVAQAGEETIQELAELNKKYKKKFGYIFIVFATGKSASEMLEILKVRLRNDPIHELEIAKAEQHKITKLRLNKLIT